MDVFLTILDVFLTILDVYLTILDIFLPVDKKGTKQHGWTLRWILYIAKIIKKKENQKIFLNDRKALLLKISSFKKSKVSSASDGNLVT